jgi:F-type H+-transporting ATPase subunit epsilon
MHCQLRSADRTFFDGDASMVVAQSPHGEFAIMDGHAPLLAVLARGPIRIHTASETRVFACRRGTLRTTGDRISLLVESAVPVEEIDLSDVEARVSQLGEGDDLANIEEKEHLALLRTVKERYG